MVPSPLAWLPPATRLLSLIGLALAVVIPVQAARSQGTPAQASKPWKLQSLLPKDSWLKLSGEYRLRWEGLDGQFRNSVTQSRLSSDDNLLLQRTILRADADFDNVDLTVEVMDSRHFGGSTRSSLDTRNVNALDFLQVYAEFQLGTKDSDSHLLRVGRQTMDFGARRFVARNRYRNTINSFLGAAYWWHSKDGDANATVFWTLPTLRRPSDLASVVDNEIELDDQDIDSQFFGAFYQQNLPERHLYELYAYGLYEDEPGTRMRQIYTPGARLLRQAAVGEFDYQFDAAYQFGDSRRSAGGPDLDHDAWFQHSSVAYTIDAPWQPRVRLAFDYVSGDRDPNDGDNNRFESLFGVPRFEFGATGIFRPIARANTISPELRVIMKPGEGMNWFVAWRGLYLASEQDAWTTAGITDPTGNSGRHVGQLFETRFRWDMCENTLRFELGGGYIAHGSFQERAPGSRNTDTAFGYAQVRWRF